MQDLKNLNHLLPDSRDLLTQMVESCGFLHKYVLSGGSALALYLGHRKSEDLDFFTYEDSLNKHEIFEYLNRFDDTRILNQTDEQIDALIGGVKITFFNAKWSFLKPEQVGRFNLATIESIAAMKVNVLFLRAKYRDYYDLYFLIRRCLNVKEVYNCGLWVMPAITFKLFTTALIYVEDVEDENIDFLEPAEKISKEGIRDFFQKELKKIR